jgi:hypothetical protein
MNGVGDPTQHPAYGATLWVFAHSGAVLGLALAVCVLGILAGAGYLWMLTGARTIAAVWIWRRFLAGLRRRGARGAFPAREHSPEYQAVMQSAGWRRRRSQAIRQAGRRCQECGAAGPLDVHHLSYAHLGDERPYELAVLCERCHERVHDR